MAEFILDQTDEAGQANPTPANKAGEAASNSAPAGEQADPDADSNGDGDPEAAAVEGEDKRTVPYQALRDEREKRQAQAEENARLRGRLEATEAMPRTVQSAEAPPSEEDQFFAKPVEYIQNEFAKREETRVKKLVERSATRASGKYDDYQDRETEFAKAARDNPQLAARMFADDDPAEFAYQWATQQANVRKYGGTEAEMRERIRAEERQSLIDEMKKDEALSTADGTPKSQARVKGAGAGASPALIDDAPLDELGGL